MLLCRVTIIMLGGVIGLWFHNKSFHVVLECICMYCIEDLENCFEAKPHRKEFLALTLEIVFEMSQSLASVKQPTRIGQNMEDDHRS